MKAYRDFKVGMVKEKRDIGGAAIVIVPVIEVAVAAAAAAALVASCKN